MNRDEEAKTRPAGQLRLVIEEAAIIQVLNEDGEDVTESRRERSDDAS